MLRIISWILLIIEVLYIIYLQLVFILCQSNSQVHVHWKGAAEIILGSCTGYLDANGGVQPINDKVS